MARRCETVIQDNGCSIKYCGGWREFTKTFECKKELNPSCSLNAGPSFHIFAFTNPPSPPFI